MRSFLAYALLLWCSAATYGKVEPKYPVSAIPAELTSDVNVVIREDHMIFRILSQSKATITVRFVATIMNANGKAYASHGAGYDKLSKITSFKASVYDASGNLIRRAKGNEVLDQSSFDGLYSDNRYKSIDLSQATYPYTVEFEHEVEYKFLFFIPGSVFLNKEKISVENASYTLIYPDGLKPRHDATNLPSGPVEEKTAEGLNQMTWTVSKLKPLKSEPWGPPVYQLAPSVRAAPSRFEYDGYVGSMDNWQEFGKWVLTLNKGKQELPEATKQHILKITAHAKTNEEKVKILYQYLQNKTRYVSIQLGIGGYQPFDATLVDQTSYGDCKALSNYMIALLQVVNIKSNYVLIESGSSATPMNTAFTSPQFDHAIVAVPNGADTLWLECTSQTKPFGYMGRFTGDRKALMLTADGAAVVKTIVYTPEQNRQVRRAEVNVLINGDATAKVKTVYSGLQYENEYLDFVVDRQYDEQKKWLQNTTDIPSFDITSFTMRATKDKIPSATVDVELSLKRFAVVSGKRLFLTPNLMNRTTTVPEKVENRKTKVVTHFAYVDEDVIEYSIPDGIYPEFLPSPVKLTSRFGEYEATFKVEQNKLVYSRKIKMNKGEFPPESYGEFVEFHRSLNKADNTKIVFLSKT